MIDNEEYTFGVSGKLIMNVLVMYDRQTDSLWSQLIGEAVDGPLKGTVLEFLPAWQTTWAEWKASGRDGGEPYEKYLRHRFNIRYNDFKKIKPYISTEFAQLFELYQYPKWAAVRLFGGIIYEPGSFGEFKFAYGFERELNSNYPYMGYVLRANYTYSF